MLQSVGFRSGGFVVLLLAAATLLPHAATAAGDRIAARYDMYYGGIPVAELALRHDNGGAAYASRLTIRTTGLVDVFVRYRGKAEVEGRFDDSGGLRPLLYDARYERRGTPRTTRVRFDPASGEVAEVATSKRGKAHESEVPEAMWADVTDPLTAFLALRAHVARVREDDDAGPIHTQVFDGRLRYDIEAVLTGRETRRVGGREVEALRLEATLTPLAGFNDNDLAKSGTKDRSFRVELLLSDDAQLIPLYMRTTSTRLPVVLQLQGD